MWEWLLFWLGFRAVRQARRGRSTKWPAARLAHLKKEPACQVCGQTNNLTVHHKRPFHLFPDLELVGANLITLCEGPGIACHITFGHLGNWSSYNPNVDDDVAAWRDKIKQRPGTT